MSTFRNAIKGNYFASKRTWMQDSRLKNSTLGLLARMLSMPEDWQFNQEWMIKTGQDKETAIRTQLKEAVKFGYVVKNKRGRDEEGKFLDGEWIVFDAPVFSEPLSDDLVDSIFSYQPKWEEYQKFIPKLDHPGLDKPVQDNQGLQDKQSSPTEKIEKETNEQAGDIHSFISIDCEKKTTLMKAFLPLNCLPISDSTIQSILRIPDGFTIEELQNAMKATSEYFSTLPEKEKDIGGFFYRAVQGKWKPRTNSEENTEENKRFASNMEVDCMKIKNSVWKLEALNKCVEISCHANKEPFVLYYHDRGFKGRLIEEMKKCKFLDSNDAFSMFAPV